MMIIGPRHLTTAAICALGLSLGVLAGCAATQTAATPEGYGLFYSENPDEGVKLAYGYPNSDAVSLMLQCRPGSGKVEVFQLSGPARTGPIALSSNLRRTTVQARAETQEGPGESVTHGWVSASAPAMGGFRETGRLRVSGKGYSYEISAKPDEHRGVQQFFSRCGTA